MREITFNDTQKSAIISLLVEMINVDKRVDPAEVGVFNNICGELHVSEDVYNIGLALDSMVALDVMKRMSDIQKIYTARLLTRVIDADALDDDNEIRLLNIICKITGIDVLINNDDQDKKNKKAKK